MFSHPTTKNQGREGLFLQEKKYSAGKKYIAKDLNSLHNQENFTIHEIQDHTSTILSRKIYHSLTVFENYMMPLDSDTNNLPFSYLSD